MENWIDKNVSILHSIPQCSPILINNKDIVKYLGTASPSNVERKQIIPNKILRMLQHA